MSASLSLTLVGRLTCEEAMFATTTMGIRNERVRNGCCYERTEEFSGGKTPLVVMDVGW
jgi:hypothetical protein